MSFFERLCTLKISHVRRGARDLAPGHKFVIPFKQATPEFVAPEWKLANHLQCILTRLIVSLFNLFPNISLQSSCVYTHNLGSLSKTT